MKRQRATDVKLQAEQWVESKATARWVAADYRSIRELLFRGYLVGYRAAKRKP